MKITPLAQGQGIADVGAASTQRTSPDRIAAAKAVAQGQSPMRQGPSDTPVDPQVARLQNNMRKLKMKTQASPDRPIEGLDTPEVTAETTPDAAQNAISSTNEEAPADEATKPLSPQFAALAKQRRALQQERAAFEQEKAKLQETSETSAGSQDWMAQLKLDPLGKLQEAGVTYDQLTEAILNGQANPAAGQIAALKAELEALKTGIDTKLTDRDTQAEQQVVAEIKREAAQAVASGDDYKYTRAMGKSAEAARLIHENWKETGEIWDLHHALGLIEAECKKDYERLSSALTPQEQAAVEQQQTDTRPQGMRTLTNRDTARPFMSRRDRMIAAFRGELKK